MFLLFIIKIVENQTKDLRKHFLFYLHLGRLVIYKQWSCSLLFKVNNKENNRRKLKIKKMEEERGNVEVCKNVEVSTKVTEPLLNVPNPRALQQNSVVSNTTIPGQSKYIQLLNVIEELGRDIRPSYAGSRTSAERIKRGIVHARILVRECLVETEKSARQ
ncbi:cyclin-dependent kinase 2-associated protein 1-like [Vespula squamosa]|uniref:Cyclin-dependent kinase 2-associated protein 1-like n=1 Tax=Vespula squamosa TaxID=30214 RepID=A0ABD1ZV97_VESSQ